MEELRNKKGFICDMDGVIYHGNRLLPGVKAFLHQCSGDRALYPPSGSRMQRLCHRRPRHNVCPAR